ncbi:MAG: hypothetical protein KBT36_06025 [Kurthia sp.]|nr:hypothetical protein [Candidatus Kurthia equi]
MKKNKLLSLIGLPLAMALLAGCGNNPQPTHEHTFSEEWSHDCEMHWHQATCEHKELSSSLSAHTYNADNICTVCGRDKNAGKQSLKIRSVNCTVDNKTSFESVYGLDDYASIVVVANDGYIVPNNIRVYSGNEIILPEHYTYVVNENRKSAEFVIKMDKSFDVSVEAVEDIEAVYVGNHKITETGDYSSIDPNGEDFSVYYSKEANELTIRDAVISEAVFGSMTFTDTEGVNVSYLITYTGIKPLTINLFGENHFIFKADPTTFTKGAIISLNGGELNIVGPGYNYCDGAGQGFIYSDGAVNIRDCFINSSKSGVYGIAARFLNIVDSTIGIYAATDKDIQIYKKGIDASDLAITRSVIDITGYMNGIFATLFRVFSSKLYIDSQIGIHGDWIYGYGERPVNNSFTTFINITGHIAGIKAFDLQEWQYCSLDVVCTDGTAITSSEGTTRFYNSEVHATSESKGDGIEAFRMVISGSKVYAKNNTNKLSGIRCNTLPMSETSADKQAFIRITNSYIHAESPYAAISGHGKLEVNGEEAFEDENNHYMVKKVANTNFLTVWGIFPLSATDFDYELDHGSAITAHPIGCTVSATLDCRNIK